MSKLKASVVKLLRAVKRDLVAHPRGFDMSEFDTCIAGRVYKISGRGLQYVVGGRTFDKLCYLRYWPERQSTQYRKAKTQKEKARLAARRIDYLIRTGGK